jgi:hypothetical protein
MWFYYAVYFLLATAFFISLKYNIQKQVYVICLVVLFVISGFRPSTCCADYLNYVDYFNDIDNRSVIQIEPTFFLISKIALYLFNSSIGVFVIYAFLGVLSKGLAFKRLSNFYLLSLIVYSATYFLLHEMTQIRVGIASSILLLSIPSIYERKYFNFLLLLILGTLFHYSFLIFGFFYFLSPNKINPTFYAVLIFSGYIAYVLGINVVSVLGIIPIDFISGKILAYNALLEKGVDTKINVFNVLMLFRLSFLTILLWKQNYLFEKNKFSILLIKIYAFSIFFFVFFSSLPVFAFRIRELTGIVEVILIPFFVYLFKEKYIGFCVIIVLGLIFMSIDIWYNKMISTYF